jgi:hypothetical protein
MLTHSEVLDDQSELRVQLQRTGGAHRELLRLNWARPLGDIAFDWASVLAATAAVAWIGPATLPIALIVVANRQRALGNILHDAGHRNLCRTRQHERRPRGAAGGAAGVRVAGALSRGPLPPSPATGRGRRRSRPAGPRRTCCPGHWAAQLSAAGVLAACVVGETSAGISGAAGCRGSDRAYIVAWWLAALALMLEVAGAPFTLDLHRAVAAGAGHGLPPDHDVARDVRPLRPEAGRHLELSRATRPCHGFVALGDPPAQQRLPPHPSPAACRAVLPAAPGALAVSAATDLQDAWARSAPRYFAGPNAVVRRLGGGSATHERTRVRWAACRSRRCWSRPATASASCSARARWRSRTAWRAASMAWQPRVGMLACWPCLRQPGCGGLGLPVWETVRPRLRSAAPKRAVALLSHRLDERVCLAPRSQGGRGRRWKCSGSAGPVALGGLVLTLIYWAPRGWTCVLRRVCSPPAWWPAAWCWSTRLVDAKWGDRSMRSAVPAFVQDLG